VLQYLLPDVAPIAEQAGIQLDLDVAAELSTSQQHIRCNLVLLAQAVRALVRHAVFRSGENGRIWLSAYLEDNRLVIQVQDEAEPIPAEIADAVFEPQGQWSNERVHDPAQAGSGLSLPLVKMIIEQMDAKIWFDPAIEPGNTFGVAFPLVI
jgi:signal transduction histidine kinase